MVSSKDVTRFGLDKVKKKLGFKHFDNIIYSYKKIEPDKSCDIKHVHCGKYNYSGFSFFFLWLEQFIGHKCFLDNNENTLELASNQQDLCF